MKETGILLAVSSLPGEHGIGDLGQCACTWIDLLHRNDISLWQILPLNPTGYANSPYQPYSSFAGDEIYLSLNKLAQQGLLPAPVEPWNAHTQRVNYEAVRRYKEPYLRAAFQAFVPNAAYHHFAAQEWVQHYAAFRAFKHANQGQCWTQWPERQRDWPKMHNGESGAFEFDEEIRYHLFLQYCFSQQWSDVLRYAHDKGVRIMGDLPFYVGLDSADVWANRDCFLLNSDGHPHCVAGVPPDYFSPTGQRWGNPIYNWEHLQQSGFQFWVQRIGHQHQLFDVIRLDHFRALDTYWCIPASCPTAQEGAWLEAPGYALLDRLYHEIPGLNLVVEDLGDLRPQVLTLRDHYQLRGMKVLEFTFVCSGKQIYDSAPHSEHQIVYTGTHDNAMLTQWYKQHTTPQRRRLRRWLKQLGFRSGSAVHRLLIYTLAEPADLVILPLQDIMELPSWCRMNTPGTIGSPNWEWRLETFSKASHSLMRLRPFLHARRQRQCAKQI